MMSIIKKTKINYLTYFFILSAVLTGMFRELIILSLIIFIHELGHIISALVFKYKIRSIEFLPFGGITKLERDINSPLKEEIIISLMGIFMQVLLGFIAIFLFQNNVIDLKTYEIFRNYNLIILIFNLLPIVPLDGHQFLKAIFEYFFPFISSFIISVILSVVFLVIFTYINIVYNFNNYIIVSFLAFKIIEAIKKHKYVSNRFFLERYLHVYNYPKIKIINGNNIKKMYKMRTHYFLSNGSLLNEEEILARKFDKKYNL